MVIEVIPFGHENAISLEEISRRSGLTGRSVRRVIREANLNGDLVLNIGNGYFRDAGKSDDNEYRHYRAMEVKRAREIMHKVRKMDGKRK